MTENDKQEEKPAVLNSINDILKLVERKEINYASHLWIPSLNDEFRFLELNTAQQKKLAKSIIDSPVFNTEFIFTFYDILKENCVDDININDLTIIDKVLIALGMRITCVGELLDVVVDIDEDGKNTQEISINLTQIYDIAKQTLTNITDEVIQDNIYEIVVGVPTIQTEFMVEKELRGDVKNIEVETVNELRDTIGSAFISEIVKYVKQVFIKNDDGELQQVTWNNFKYQDRIKIVEHFGSNLLKEIVHYTNKVKDEVDKVELVNFTYEGKEYKRRLTIDGSFFIVS